MIFLFKKFPREEVLSIISSQYPKHELVRFSDDYADPTEIIHVLNSGNLFGTDQVIFLSDINRDFWNSIIDSFQHKPESTIVFWLEDSFPVAFLKNMPTYEMKEYQEKKSVEKSNPFAIANQLSSGSSSGLWTTYRSLLSENQAPEAIFGILWWKLKDLARKKQTINSEFKKTLKNFLSTYSSARETGGELETGLEELLLKLTKKDL